MKILRRVDDAVRFKWEVEEAMSIAVGEQIQIYFATNRRLRGALTNPEFGDRNHADGPSFYRVGTAIVEKRSNDLDEGYSVERVIVKGEGNTNPDNRGSDGLFADIRQDLDTRPRDALVYIHGFANTFESSITRAAQLYEKYMVGPLESPQHPLVFAFCWPSNGAVTPPWEYFSDRDDARDAGPAMARTMLRFSDYVRRTRNPCRQRIHLVAHSMGNWALRHAVQALVNYDSGKRLEHLFENAFLMAADEDDDAFEKDEKLRPLLRLARRIYVYHSNDDLSLVISDTTKFNPNRLGFEGPRNLSSIDERIITIDCEAVDDTEFAHVNHQYYRRRSEVIADVQHVLAGFRPDNIPGRLVIQPGRHYRIRPTDEG